jgi:predicted transcriptional regulator
MPRRNLTGGWGESSVVTVRLVPADRRRLYALAARWNVTASEAIRRAIREAAQPGDEETPIDWERVKR